MTVVAIIENTFKNNKTIKTIKCRFEYAFFTVSHFLVACKRRYISGCCFSVCVRRLISWLFSAKQVTT